jgi:uncharacterized protein (TIGR02145 family)
MKKLLLGIAILVSIQVSGQTYLIDFLGTGASSTVNTVIVENLTTGATLTMNGSDILRLTTATGTIPVEDNVATAIRIYPNPMKEYSIIDVTVPTSGNATITVSDISGKTLSDVKFPYDKTNQVYKLSGIKSGLYVVTVKGIGFQYSAKLISQLEETGNIKIEQMSTQNKMIEEKSIKQEAKSILATVDMAYASGNRLKFTGKSGIYANVKTDIPSNDKTITFSFTPCTDGDNNNYSIVEIGTQVWMAENLKTTKYNDGTEIPLVTDNKTWDLLTTPAYCWSYNNEAFFKEIFGALYDWYALDAAHNGSKNVCPTGWHVPSVNEFTTLGDYLGGTGVAGGKLKETGTTHWYPLNEKATNESGFTALPGGYRSYDGSFQAVGERCEFWTSLEVGYNDIAYFFGLLGSSEQFPGSGYTNEDVGMSIRCLKDN